MPHGDMGPLGARMTTHHGASDRLPMRAAASSGTRFSSLSASSPCGPPRSGLYVSPCHPISRSSAVFSNPAKRDIQVPVQVYMRMNFNAYVYVRTACIRTRGRVGREEADEEDSSKRGPRLFTTGFH